MEAGDLLTIILVLAGVWYVLMPAWLRDVAVGGAADIVRAAWRAVAPLVRWLAYDVIVGRRAVNRSADAPPALLSTDEDADGDDRAVQPAPAPMGADGATAVQRARTDSTEGVGAAPGGGLDLTAEELVAVQKMLYAHRRALAFGQALSKTDAIKAGFGVGRSGSNPKYQRASAIYDSLLGEPEPAVKYPTLAAQREH